MNKKKEKILPLASACRIIKEATGMRVSDAAAMKMREVIEDKGKIIATKAGQLARHSGRATIKEGDITLASAD